MTINQDDDNGTFVISIKNAEEFWKISKYLVVIVN